jgi:hypothetical protein
LKRPLAVQVVVRHFGTVTVYSLPLLRETITTVFVLFFQVTTTLISHVLYGTVTLVVVTATAISVQMENVAAAVVATETATVLVATIVKERTIVLLLSPYSTLKL